MRFALLGDHPDGLDLALSLTQTGRHHLVAYSGPAAGADKLRRGGIEARSIGDVEEILADPVIDAVIVASKPADRPGQLRRAVQSERHVLCVHPADDKPDIAYEAAMIQADTGVVLLPLLPETLHPAVQRLAELLPTLPGSIHDRLVEFERASTENVLLEADLPGQAPGIPGWDVLRFLGGEIIEIVGLSFGEEVTGATPLLLAGRFERGGLFQVTLLPGQREARRRLHVRTGLTTVTLDFPEGFPGPARLTWQDDLGEAHEETWEDDDPWRALVEVFESATGRAPPPLPAEGPGSDGITVLGVRTAAPAQLRWQDAVRCLELDDAARRSVERRRASTLEYQEVTEEAGFKGTMTLVGCSLIWGSLLALILAIWIPWLGWFILPGFGLFLLLQLLRWVVQPRPSETAPASAPRALK